MSRKRNRIDTTIENLNETAEGKKTLEMLIALEGEDRMSDWETEFVIDITDKVMAQGTLSRKQFDCLEKIYNKFN